MVIKKPENVFVEFGRVVFLNYSFSPNNPIILAHRCYCVPKSPQREFFLFAILQTGRFGLRLSIFLGLCEISKPYSRKTDTSR